MFNQHAMLMFKSEIKKKTNLQKHKMCKKEKTYPVPVGADDSSALVYKNKTKWINCRFTKDELLICITNHRHTATAALAISFWEWRTLRRLFLLPSDPAAADTMYLLLFLAVCLHHQKPTKLLSKISQIRTEERKYRFQKFENRTWEIGARRRSNEFLWIKGRQGRSSSSSSSSMDSRCHFFSFFPGRERVRKRRNRRETVKSISSVRNLKINKFCLCDQIKSTCFV